MMLFTLSTFDVSWSCVFDLLSAVFPSFPFL